ncbi:MAG: polysaccharide biosynthesis tyrosine autokinase [Planctomycetes bacterium]|nr:polysaccharide biosynthesis tyrosine autokinase [Planctomycetota bacterium]
MTTAPAMPAPASAPRPATPPSAPSGGGVGTATIDPFKIVNKYKFWLAGAVAVGAVLGVAAHIVLLRVAPTYRPVVLFEVNMTPLSPGTVTSIVPKDDYQRLMQTEVQKMKGENILRAVVEDPRFEKEAPAYAEEFREAGGINTRKALRQLQKDVAARVIPETRLISLTVGYKVAGDATGILKLIREKYELDTRNDVRRKSAGQIQTLTKQVSEADAELAALQRQREGLIGSGQVDSLDDRAGTNRELLGLISKELVDVDNKLKAAGEAMVIYDEQLKNPAGITYSDTVRAQVENEPELQEIKRTISNLTSRLDSIKLRGMSENHREYKEVVALIEGYTNSETTTRERLLRTRFDGEVDNMRTTIRQFTAQRDDLNRRREEIRTQLVDLTRIQSQISDIDKKLGEKSISRRSFDDSLRNVTALSEMDAAQRVVVLQQERIPDQAAFPDIKMMLPLGVLVVLSLVGGVIVLREILDQRVKGPADIAMIPRTRVLGFIPDAIEDPSGTGAVETAMRDRNKGVIAEAFRVIRGTLTKRLSQTGHRTVVVMAGMPGSGATSVATNLAIASGAAGQRVLVIDANLRRPALQRVFGLAETPGLVDVLTGTVRLDQAVQRTSDGTLSVMAVGSRDKRNLEILATSAMNDLLAEARAKFDLVIIDVAPAIVSGDGMALAGKCDASILVVKAMSEKRGLVARIRNDLLDTRAEFLGVIVNSVKSSAGGYLKGNIKASSEYQAA